MVNGGSYPMVLAGYQETHMQDALHGLTEGEACRRRAGTASFQGSGHHRCRRAGRTSAPCRMRLRSSLDSSYPFFRPPTGLAPCAVRDWRI